MTKLFLTLAIALGTFQPLAAQSKIIYHVNTKALSLKGNAGAEAQSLKSLKKYDNLTLLESITGKEWVKVKYKQLEGYVLSKALKSGEAVVTYSSVKTGAICTDGSSSSATGRGACSRHGGVSRWKTERQQKVAIIENN